MDIPHALHIKKFDRYIETISELYQGDDDFRALCDDYCATKLNLEKMKGDFLKNKAREIEFKSLFFELEREIVEYIISRR